MPRLRLLSLILALAAPATAQETLPPSGFEQLSEGHTLHFTLGGEPFGDEQYFSGRRSLWRYTDGTCAAGRWRDEGDEVCFRYDPESGEQCWRFSEGPGGLAANLVEGGEATGFVLRMSHMDQAPLPCPGPKVGS